MGYMSYRKIPRLNKEENKNLLENACYVSYKLDGTNAVIWCDEDEVFHTGSRTREISLGKDNAGFAAWFEDEEEEEILFIKNALRHHPELILFGEFLGVNKFIGNIKDYYKSALKTFWIFDIYDRKAQRYYTPLELIYFCEKHSLEAWLIPHFYLGDPSEDKIKEIAEKNNFLIATPDRKGEGVVIKSEDGARCAKYVLEVKKDKSIQKTEEDIEQWIIDEFLFPSEIAKARAKAALILGSEDLTNKSIGCIFNLCIGDMLAENIVEICKRKKNPVVDFKKVNILAKEKIREYLF